MKKLILLLMIILSTLSFASKKLYVATNAEFKPYEYLEGDKITGFDIDFMNAIGKEIGYEVHWVNMGFDGLLPALQMNKVDAVIAGMSQTPERQKAVSFSVPYIFFTSEHYVIVNENSTFKTKEDLQGKTAGVQMGSMQEQFAINNGSIPKLYNTFTNALMDLQNGKVDCVIIADNSGKEYLKTMDKIKKIDAIIDPKPGASIAFRKSDKELAEKFSVAIAELKSTKEYAELVEKYFPERFEDFKAQNLTK